jgi:hypothetical protein
MAVSITIDSVDRTARVLKRSFRVSQQMGSRRICSFTAYDKSDGWRPDVGDRVLVQDGSTYVFSGHIDDYSETVFRPTSTVRKRRNYAIQCVSDEAVLDRRIVANSYTAQTLGAIVADVVSAALAGDTVDTTNVATGPTLALVNFDYEPASQVFNELAELTGYAYWMPPAASPTLYFQARGSVAAPFAFDSTAATPNYLTATARRHRDTYRNKQYLRGGITLTSARTESWKGDSATRTFVTGFPVGKVPSAVTVGGVAKTIGINQVETGKDWYWNEGSNEIVQDAAGTLLTSADTLAVTYQGQYPLIISAQLDTEISARAAAESTSGYYESKEDDASITDQQAAIDKTTALLVRYGTIPVDVHVVTHTAGLEVGQLVSVRMPELGLAGFYLVQDLEIAWRVAEKFTYAATILSGDGIGGWVKFFRTLMESKDQFVIRSGEVILLVRAASDAAVCSASVVASTSTPESRVGFGTIGFSQIG